MDEFDVVVTGLGVISPNGYGIQEFWNNSTSGISGLKKKLFDDKFEFLTSSFGVIDSDIFINQKEEDLYLENSRYARLAMCTSDMAINDANITPSELASSRAGVCLASAIADAKLMEEILTGNISKNNVSNGDGIESWMLNCFNYSKVISNISRKYNCTGGVHSISTGCTAGVDAVGFALNQIRSGICDVMIVGASEAPLCPLAVGAFESLGALSKHYDVSPNLASMPFSKNRSGFVLAEGGGFMVLESYAHAKKRNARMYAQVSGYASVNNAFHMTDLSANGETMAECIKLAIEDSGCEIGDVNYINAHGSSTPQNDINETNAFKKVFGKRAYEIPINSLKSLAGHALSAANIIEMIGLCLSIKHNKLYPTINYCEADPECDLDYVVNNAREWPINVALKTSSGFSGIHSVMVFKTI